MHATSLVASLESPAVLVVTLITQASWCCYLCFLLPNQQPVHMRVLGLASYRRTCTLRLPSWTDGTYRRFPPLIDGRVFLDPVCSSIIVSSLNWMSVLWTFFLLVFVAFARAFVLLGPEVLIEVCSFIKYVTRISSYSAVYKLWMNLRLYGV